MEIKTMIELIDKYNNDEKITAENYAEFYSEKWVSVEDIKKELTSLKIDINYHFEKVENPKLSVINGIDYIIRKIK